MNRLIILAAAVSLSAQTAVGKLIVKYEDTREQDTSSLREQR